MQCIALGKSSSIVSKTSWMNKGFIVNVRKQERTELDLRYQIEDNRDCSCFLLVSPVSHSQRHKRALSFQ